MARKPPRLTVDITPNARRDLHSIWDYNCDTYDVDHADRYMDFLADQTKKLRTEYLQGKSVPTRPDYRYRSIRKGRGHGYVLVYQVVNDAVEVIHYFHTAQDWQGKLEQA
jgi:addiction module RelE/StbE family toxin